MPPPDTEACTWVQASCGKRGPQTGALGVVVRRGRDVAADHGGEFPSFALMASSRGLAASSSQEPTIPQRLGTFLGAECKGLQGFWPRLGAESRGVPLWYLISAVTGAAFPLVDARGACAPKSPKARKLAIREFSRGGLHKWFWRDSRSMQDA